MYPFECTQIFRHFTSKRSPNEWVDGGPVPRSPRDFQQAACRRPLCQTQRHVGRSFANATSIPTKASILRMRPWYRRGTVLVWGVESRECLVNHYYWLRPCSVFRPEESPRCHLEIKHLLRFRADGLHESDPSTVYCIALKLRKFIEPLARCDLLCRLPPGIPAIESVELRYCGRLHFFTANPRGSQFRS